jgi:hypothetical protein
MFPDVVELSRIDGDPCAAKAHEAAPCVWQVRRDRAASASSPIAAPIDGEQLVDPRPAAPATAPATFVFPPTHAQAEAALSRCGELGRNHHAESRFCERRRPFAEERPGCRGIEPIDSGFASVRARSICAKSREGDSSDSRSDPLRSLQARPS